MIKKIVSLLMVIGILTVVLAGCNSTTTTSTPTSSSSAASSQVQTPVTLSMTYWNPVQKSIMDTLNAEFMAANPNIKVQLSQIPGDSYETVLKTRFLADNAPDVYLMFAASAYLYGKQGYYGDITNETFANNIQESAKGSCTYQGKLYAVPFSTLGSCVFYNKTVFSDAGITIMPKVYNDFLAICEKIKKSGITPIARGGKDLWTALHETGPLAANFVLGLDPTFQKDLYNGTTTFASNAGMKDYLTRYKYLVDQGYIAKGILGLTHTQAAAQVANGQCAMMMGISVFYTDIMSANAKADIGQFALPDDKGKSYQIGASNEALGFYPKGKYIDAAKTVVGFYATPAVNKEFCDSTQSLPCIKNVTVNLAQPLNEIAQSLADSTTIFNWLDVSWPLAASDTYRTAINSISSGSTDINKMLTDIDKSYADNKSTITEPSLP